MSFSVLNVLPLTGEVMGLDHVHLHAAVNQQCHSPHTAKTANSSTCSMWNKMQEHRHQAHVGKPLMQKVKDFCKAEQSAEKNIINDKL